jgi:glycosyltransferase involved in cell wall biosynthesis
LPFADSQEFRQVMSSLSCSVVICTRNRPEVLARALQALKQQTIRDFELVVVDSAPNGHPAGDVTSRYGARCVVEPVPGLARARNRGARCCHTDLVAYLDDDCLPSPDWLERILAEFQDDRVIAVGGRVEGILPEQGVEPWHYAAARDSRRPQRRRVDSRTAGWFELANFGALGDGNMAFRRAAFNVWPGFDERLGRGGPLHGGEEHHAFFSLIDRGYAVVYTPAAVVRHPLPLTASELRGRCLKELRGTAAYVSMLWSEQPRYRAPLLRFVLEGLLGRRRSWRDPATRVPDSIVPRWRALLAVLSGPLLYRRVRAAKCCEAVEVATDPVS